MDVIILAGGRSSRMGGRDKSFALWHGKPLIEHSLDFARPRARHIFISSNKSPENFARYEDVTVIPDPGELMHTGPLAGILAGLENTRENWLLTLPVDTPELPPALTEELFKAVSVNHAVLAVAAFAGNCQQVIGLWHRSLAPELRAWLEGGERRVMPFIRQACAPIVDFDHMGKNMNHPSDLAEART